MDLPEVALLAEADATIRSTFNIASNIDQANGIDEHSTSMTIFAWFL